MVESKRFQRTPEDFVCLHCGHVVQGNGYTNHCPKCLWSKHVDVYPGDRAEWCGGMMPPVELQTSGLHYILVHRCERCGFERRNRTSPDDDFDAILQVSVPRSE